jgi:hypothetical protein
MTDRADLVEVAYVPDRAQAEMILGLLESNGIPSLLQQTGINGPLVGVGLLPDAAQRVMVDPDRADAARTLLANQVGDPKLEAEHESAAFEYPNEARGRRPRNYSVIGAYARIWAWSLAAMGAAFGIFLLLRSL